jgi:hypothetical protein
MDQENQSPNTIATFLKVKFGDLDTAVVTWKNGKTEVSDEERRVLQAYLDVFPSLGEKTLHNGYMYTASIRMSWTPYPSPNDIIYDQKTAEFYNKAQYMVSKAFFK